MVAHRVMQAEVVAAMMAEVVGEVMSRVLVVVWIQILLLILDWRRMNLEQANPHRHSWSVDLMAAFSRNQAVHPEVVFGGSECVDKQCL